MKVASLALPFSCVDGIEWPAIASPAGATMLATQWQLDRSQWWPAERILEHQFRQLRELVTHAIAHSPHYKAHLSRSGLTSVEQLTPETFLRWPLLPNGEVPRNEAALRASLYPREHA
ncbi:MAG: hypothetical protein ACREUN_02145, partial [Burkholderiales bacterium]